MAEKLRKGQRPGETLEEYGRRMDEEYFKKHGTLFAPLVGAKLTTEKKTSKKNPPKSDRRVKDMAEKKLTAGEQRGLAEAKNIEIMLRHKAEMEKKQKAEKAKKK